jgi:hypothetical protein
MLHFLSIYCLLRALMVLLRVWRLQGELEDQTGLRRNGTAIHALREELQLKNAQMDVIRGRN